MRIIAGKARGRKLIPPATYETRPTLDRVKEAMFSMIQAYIPDATVVDVFAGTGSLGLEAASRGAKECYLFDKSNTTYPLLKENVKNLKFEDFCHLDVIKRGAKIFDRLIIAVLINVDKKGLFEIEERVELIKRVTKDIKNVEVVSFNGLLIDLLREKEADVILKGLRGVLDFEYEMQMALINNKLDSNVETLFMMTAAENSYISSSSVKQIAKFGGNINGLVPNEIINDIEKKINRD